MRRPERSPPEVLRRRQRHPAARHHGPGPRCARPALQRRGELLAHPVQGDAPGVDDLGGDPAVGEEAGRRRPPAPAPRPAPIRTFDPRAVSVSMMTYPTAAVTAATASPTRKIATACFPRLTWRAQTGMARVCVLRVSSKASTQRQPADEQEQQHPVRVPAVLLGLLGGGWFAAGGADRGQVVHVREADSHAGHIVLGVNSVRQKHRTPGRVTVRPAGGHFDKTRCVSRLRRVIITFPPVPTLARPPSRS